MESIHILPSTSKAESQYYVLPLALHFVHSHDSKWCPNTLFDRILSLNTKSLYLVSTRIFTLKSLHSSLYWVSIWMCILSLYSLHTLSSQSDNLCLATQQPDCQTQSSSFTWRKVDWSIKTHFNCDVESQGALESWVYRPSHHNWCRRLFYLYRCKEEGKRCAAWTSTPSSGETVKRGGGELIMWVLLQ